MSEMESNGLLPSDVKARYYKASIPATLSLEYCARYDSCDQWSFYSVGKKVKVKTIKPATTP